MRLFDLLRNPAVFFDSIRGEGWKPAFNFFLEITMTISVVTPVVNYLGIESTDFSSAYQAQILAFRFLSDTLLPQYGVYAYFIEAFLIVGFSLVILFFPNALCPCSL